MAPLCGPTTLKFGLVARCEAKESICGGHAPVQGNRRGRAAARRDHDVDCQPPQDAVCATQGIFTLR